MVRLATVQSGFEAKVLAARLGAEGIVWELRGGVDGPYPMGPVTVLVDEMARHGFDPTVRRRGDVVDLTLRTCPFVSTARADPDTVCELHLGMAQGMAETLEGLQIDELIRNDPRRAHCHLRGRLVSPP